MRKEKLSLCPTISVGVLQNWLSVGMLHGASDVKVLTIRGCASVHPYAPIIITDSATPPTMNKLTTPGIFDDKINPTFS